MNFQILHYLQSLLMYTSLASHIEAVNFLVLRHYMLISSFNYAWNSVASRLTKILIELIKWDYNSQSYKQETIKEKKSGGGRKINKAWKMAGKKT